MTTALGEQAITNSLLANERVGAPNKRVPNAWVDTLHYTALDPPAGGGGGPVNLQDVCNEGNTTTTDINLNGGDLVLQTTASELKFAADPLNPDGTIQVVPGSGSGHRMNFNVEDTTGVLRNVLTINEDSELTMNAGSVIIKGLTDEVRVGTWTGGTTIGDESVNIGESAGENNGIRSVAIGYRAGVGGANRAVSVGEQAGETGSGNSAISVGVEAGTLNLGDRGIAIGNRALAENANAESIGIGRNAGAVGAGSFSVAIGSNAGSTQLDDNSIILNATGTSVNTTAASQFIVDPIHTNTDQKIVTDRNVCWNSTTKQVEAYKGNVKTFLNTIASTLTLTADYQDVIICNMSFPFNSGTTVNLPALSTLQVGRTFTIKGYSNTSKFVTIVPFTGDDIEFSSTNIVLGWDSRSSSGGGGASIDLMKLDDAQWVIVGGYNAQTDA